MQPKFPDFQNTGDTFSDCRSYRYKLWRLNQPARSLPVAFLMLNPSTATATQNDPTVARCERRAAMLGFDGFFIINIFALVSTDPRELYLHPDPVGPDNDQHIQAVGDQCGVIICAWGHHGGYRERGAQILDSFAKRNLTRKLWCLGLNADGSPAHPLYLPYDRLPRRMEPPYSRTEWRAQ